MSYLLDKAFQLALMVAFFLVFAILVFAGVFVANKRKRKNRKEEDSYYQELDRYDSQSYLDFEDITDGMVVSEGHRRFVGAIKCIGYDFYSSSGVQQAATMDGYREFLRSITSPITFVQSFVRMRMEHTQSMYSERYAQIERELFHKEEDRKVYVEQLNQVRGADISAEEAFLKKIEELQKEIANLSWRRAHLREQMKFMERLSNKDAMEPDTEQVYLFEWEFVPSQYNVEFTEEEIHKKAIMELNALGARLISALGQANVRAFRCTTEELIEMFYCQSHPLSAMEFKMPDVANSPFFDFVATTTNIEEHRKNVYEDMMTAEAVRMIHSLGDNLQQKETGGMV